MKWVVQSAFATILLLILSCTSLSKGDFVGQSQEVQLYKQALASFEPNTRCASFVQLSKVKHFALQDMALIRSHIDCEAMDLEPIPKDLNLKSPWLRKLNSEAKFRDAQKSASPIMLAEAYLEMAKISTRPAEKVKLLQQAIDQAKLAQDQNLIADLEQRLYRVAPRFIPKPTPKQWIAVAQDWLGQRKFHTGRSFLNKLIAHKGASFQEVYLAKKILRNSYKIEPNRAKYLSEARALANWLSGKKDYEKLNEALLTLARAQWTDGMPTQATTTLKEAEKKLASKYPLDEVYFIRGRIFDEAKNYPQALAFLDKALLEDPDGNLNLKDKIYFSKAWTQRKMNQFQQSADTLAELLNKIKDGPEKYKYLFWQARSLKDAGLGDQAKPLFEQIRDGDLLGFYGLLAYREMGEALPPLGVANPSNWIFARQVETGVRQKIFAMIEVGEKEVLERYLDFQTEKLTNQPADEGLWFFFLKSYAAAGLYLPLFSQINSMPAVLKEHLLRDHPELLFPRNYLSLIEAAGQRFQVRPEFMLSIIRQESAFNPFARSHADAFGLMQILPSVAKQEESRTGIVIKNLEELYVPENNVVIGASLLSRLWSKQKGQFLLTAASYNASERAIRGWLKHRFREDPLEFIEEVPYEETRGYMKLVLRNFVFYSRLADPQNPLPFPEWCLQNIQPTNRSTSKAHVSR